MTKEYLESPIGLIEVTGDDAVIYAVQFVNERAETEPYRFLPKELAKCLDQLQEYFDGRRDRFELNLAERGTDFQRKVWAKTTEIPKGEVMTYKKLAAECEESSPRAVGNALGKNPFLIVIPCHRVLASSGDLTGYAGGTDRKEWLLKHERAFTPPTQLSLF
jgi:methylated-DNA-[protein]-cysteine S-methyltransferase